VVDRKQDQRTHQRHEESGGLTFLVVTDRLADPGAKKRSGNTQKDGDDEAAWIFSGHDELRQCTHYESNYDRPQDVTHNDSFAVSFDNTNVLSGSTRLPRQPAMLAIVPYLLASQASLRFAHQA
jgi:hypothetical protein